EVVGTARRRVTLERSGSPHCGRRLRRAARHEGIPPQLPKRHGNTTLPDANAVAASDRLAEPHDPDGVAAASPERRAAAISPALLVARRLADAHAGLAGGWLAGATDAPERCDHEIALI